MHSVRVSEIAHFEHGQSDNTLKTRRYEKNTGRNDEIRDGRVRRILRIRYIHIERVVVLMRGGRGIPYRLPVDFHKNGSLSPVHLEMIAFTRDHRLVSQRGIGIVFELKVPPFEGSTRIVSLVVDPQCGHSPNVATRGLLNLEYIAPSARLDGVHHDVELEVHGVHDGSGSDHIPFAHRHGVRMAEQDIRRSLGTCGSAEESVQNEAEAKHIERAPSVPTSVHQKCTKCNKPSIAAAPHSTANVFWNLNTNNSK